MMEDSELGSKGRSLTPEWNPKNSNGQTCKPGSQTGGAQVAFSPKPCNI